MNTVKKIITNKEGNGVLFFLLIFVSIVLCGQFYLKNQLKKTYEHSSGQIIKLVSGGPSGSIHFIYPENEGAKYNNAMRITWPSCRKIITKHMKLLQSKKFPVVYAKNNLNNAEVLIFEDQYEKYGVEIPIDLKEIVKVLSECKN
jgi:hypothetical protein